MVARLQVFICFCLLLTGCTQYRHWASPNVAHAGKPIVTKNKYHIVEFLSRHDHNHWFMSYTSVKSIQSAADEVCPGIFSPDGIPITIEEGLLGDSVNHTEWTTFFPFFCSVFTLPQVADVTSDSRYTIKVGDATNETFIVNFRHELVNTAFSPLALLFQFDEHPGLANTEFTSTGATLFKGIAEERPGSTETYSKAIAYGIASKLMEMEDSGMIDMGKVNALESSRRNGFNSKGDVIERSDEQDKDGLQLDKIPDFAKVSSIQTMAVQSSAYKIVSFDRESGSGFAYRFVLSLQDEDKTSLHVLRQVQKEFRAAVKEDYIESFPGVKQDSLYVDFSEYKLTDGKIEGRAVVLTISVTSLAYDPNTRKGKLAVKVNANQYEEARKWIRKNIETLARDKNIALTTGEIPPAAKFYLGREELKDGSVLEIEFRTE